MKQMLIEVYFNYDIVLLSNRGYDCILIFSFKFVFKPISAYKNPCFAKATGGAYSAPQNPPAALVEHQRWSITRYASKKSYLEHCQRSGFVGSRDKENTYLNLQKMYWYHTRQGAD